MEKFNKRIIMVFSAFLFLFISLVLYMTYFQIVKAKDLQSKKYSAYDGRNFVDENKIKRGTVYDSGNNILIETRKDSDGNNYRYFPYEDMYAPVTGYNSKDYGKTGLELSYGPQLLNVKENTPLSELKKLVDDQEVGNDVYLTTNADLQRKSMELLASQGKGSVVAMNPKTGEIYSMASLPTINPNTVTANWQDIIAVEEDARLINRATQGQYIPGSVFKPITATSILEHQDKVSSLVIEDSGSITIGGYKISNVNDMFNGTTDLEKALVNSSNVYFAKLAAELGSDILKETVDKYYIGKGFDFDLPMAKSQNGYDDNPDDAKIAATAFGQGETLVTPLNMAMVMSSLANNGQMMMPYVVDKVVSPEGETLEEKKPELLSEVTTPEIANEILEDMIAVVRNSVNVSLWDIEIAGKSGTAEIKDTESTNAWFIATAPAKDPVIAVAVVLEDSGTGGEATAGPIARDIIREALNLGLGAERNSFTN